MKPPVQIVILYRHAKPLRHSTSLYCFLSLSLSLWRKKMYGARLEQQLYDFTRSLQDQGILDDRFDQLKELDKETPGLAVEVIAMFIRDADYGIEGLERKLFRSKPVLNYPKVTDLTHKLKGISASVGGCRVAAACSELRESSLAYNKEKCFSDFDVVKREYIYLREKLHQILEMERTIIAPYDTKKRRK